MMHQSVQDLWPRPNSVESTGGSLAIDGGFLVSTRDEALREDAHRLQHELTQLVPGSDTSVQLSLDSSLAPQSHELTIAADGIRIVGGDPAGVFYGGRTLLQLTRMRSDGIPQLVVRDAPDLLRRGVMLDVSRDKVPTMETLFELVDAFANLKLNELQLYTEHTFAYAQHEVVWRDSSPLTAEEIRALDNYCAERHVELVPNQQSFGHLHRWLVHDQYAYLAEHLEGVEHPFSPHKEPYGLCATDPRSLEFLGELYDELLPNFRSRKFNVGLDETIDLGLGRSNERCEATSKHDVYLEFLHGVNALVKERDHVMQYWADEVEGRVELARRLPADATALVWGYEANHPFDEKLAPLAEAGLETVVCPGTSSWQSLSGRTQNALGNLTNATRAAHRHDSSGLLVCDWGDRGHLQPLPVSWLGFLGAAGLAWRAESAEGLDSGRIAHLLDVHVFEDEAGVLGEVFCELGRVHEIAGGDVANGTAPFFLIAFSGEPHPHERTSGMTRDRLAQARDRLEELDDRAGTARSRRKDAELIRREITWIAEFLGFATRLGETREQLPSGSRIEELPAAVRSELAEAIPALLDQHEAVWTARNRRGGMDRSRGQLTRLRDRLA